MTPERLREIAQIIDPEAFEVDEFGCYAVVTNARSVALAKARAIASLIEAARAEGQKDMQERCMALADADISDLNEKSIAHKAAGDLETMYRINAAWHSVRSLYTAIAALPMDGANQIQSPPAPDREAVARISDKDMRWLLSATDVGAGRSRLRSLLGGTR